MVRPVFLLVALGLVLVSSAEGYYFKSSKHIHHQRHHPQVQRYPHLERLLNRLEKVQTTTPTPPPHPPVHHWNPQGQDSYEDEDEDDFDNDEDDFDDDDDEDEEEDEDEVDGDDSLRQQPQGDGHTPSWDVPQNEPHYQPMSPISRMKWQTLGTRKSVEEARSQRLGLTNSGYKVSQNDPELRKAVDHMVRMSVEGECKIPKPKLVQVKSEYPHPSKIYLPRCTILHQCGEDTGCCKTETLTCVPRFTNRVELYFYTSTMGSSAPPGVEKLTFYNHTECMCENRSAAMMHRDVESGHYFRRSANYVYRKSEPERTDTNNCRCPSKFSVRYGRDGACTCDCFDKQRECLRLKKGKDLFSAQDRQCIQNEDCRLPSCEFGSYFRLAGRCRRKRERYEGWNP